MPKLTDNFYERLGVAPNASREEIIKACEEKTNAIREKREEAPPGGVAALNEARDTLIDTGMRGAHNDKLIKAGVISQADIVQQPGGAAQPSAGPKANPASDNLYERLGVSPDATDTQIRKAYYKAAAANHPDKYPAGSYSQEQIDAAKVRFIQVNQAYKVLSDPSNKGLYDASLKADAAKPAAPSSPTAATTAAPAPASAAPAKKEKGWLRRFATGVNDALMASIDKEHQEMFKAAMEFWKAMMVLLNQAKQKLTYKSSEKENPTAPATPDARQSASSTLAIENGPAAAPAIAQGSPPLAIDNRAANEQANDQLDAEVAEARDQQTAKSTADNTSREDASVALSVGASEIQATVNMSPPPDTPGVQGDQLEFKGVDAEVSQAAPSAALSDDAPSESAVDAAEKAQQAGMAPS